MSITVYETVESRELVADRNGQGNSATREYIAQSTDHETDVEEIRDEVANAAPEYYLRLKRSRLQAKPMGGGLWRVTVEYTPSSAFEHPEGGFPESQNIQLDHALGMELGFSTSGATQHITQSLETVQSRGCALFGEPPKTNQAIGVSRQGVQGTDVAVPKFELTITRKLTILRMAYIHKLVDCTATVNRFFWNTFEPFSVLFLGAEGSPIETNSLIKQWTVNYRFLIGKNLRNLKIGGEKEVEQITIPVKHAHDYLWVGYRDARDLIAGLTVQIPAYAKIERVYDSRNFAERLEF